MTMDERALDLWNRIFCPKNPFEDLSCAQDVILDALKEAVVAERERCRQVVLKEAAFWRQEWKYRDDREAQLFGAAATVLASLIAKSPEVRHDA